MFLVPIAPRSTEFSRSFERLLDGTFDRLFSSPIASETSSARSPALDVAESDRGYTAKLDLPGVAKEDVQVSIEGRRVTVQAASQREEERQDSDRLVYRERAVARYARSFTLPVEVDQAETAAKLENGVLTLTLPKRQPKSAARIAIN